MRKGVSEGGGSSPLASSTQQQGSLRSYRFLSVLLRALPILFHSVSHFVPKAEVIFILQSEVEAQTKNGKGRM